MSLEARDRSAPTGLLLGPDRPDALADRVDREWVAALQRWRGNGPVVLLDEALTVLARAAFPWVGLDQPPATLQRRARQLGRMIEGAERLGPSRLRARIARGRARRWAGRAVRRVRSGTGPTPAGPLAAIAELRGEDGRLLPVQSAADRLLSLLLPVLAAAWPASMAGLLLVGLPSWRPRLRTGDRAAREAFLAELVRRYPMAGRYPTVSRYAQPDPVETAELVSRAAVVLAALDFVVPAQDLSVAPHRLPARPRSGLVLSVPAMDAARAVDGAQAVDSPPAVELPAAERGDGADGADAGPVAESAKGADLAARERETVALLSAAQVLVFDLDGTLVDSSYQHALAWQRAFRRLGVPIPVWQLHRAIGMGGDQLVAAVAGPQLEREAGDRLRAAWRAEFDQLLEEVQPLPSAHELLVSLRAAGRTVTLASSAPGEHLSRYLDLLGAHGLVQGRTSADDVAAGKPRPDPIAAALAQLPGWEQGRPPGAAPAVVIGDSTWDMIAAGRLGLPAVGVRSGGFCADELLDSGAGLVLESLAQLGALLLD